ncbi:MAG TPA: hypothetical protein DGT23_22455 [Micromonosporaceae bacterium]|nr:hypothetical protein [Micromonosporaceae bacterium]
MTAPNPAGQYRQMMRETLQEWLTAQAIDGVAEVYPGDLREIPWDEHLMSNPDTACVVIINLPRTTEDRAAGTGPTDRGGKDRHYSVELEVTHRGMDAEDGWEDSRNDYDRIIDALLDCLRGSGRELGRPDVVFQIGEWPRSAGIVDEHDEPFLIEDAGVVERRGVISFTLTQYLPTDVP